MSEPVSLLLFDDVGDGRRSVHLVPASDAPQGTLALATSRPAGPGKRRHPRPADAPEAERKYARRGARRGRPLKGG